MSASLSPRAIFTQFDFTTRRCGDLSLALPAMRGSLWKKIVHFSPDAVCISSERGLIEYVNPAFERLFGYAATAILGHTLDCLTAEARSRFPPAAIFALLRTQQYWQGEDWRRHAAGHLVPVHITAIRREDTNGQVTGFVSMFVDLSATKRRADHLRTVRRLVVHAAASRTLDDLAQQAVIAAAQLVEVEFAALAVLTADGARLQYRWWHLAAAPPQTPSIEALTQPFARDHGPAGQALRTACPIVTADYPQLTDGLPGLHRLGAVTVVDYPVNERAVLTVASLHRRRHFADEEFALLDIVARQIALAFERDRFAAEAQLSHQRLDQIIRHNADAILVTDDRGAIKFANPAAERLLGRSEAELIDFPLGLTSQQALDELEVHRPDGRSVPVDIHAMETTWDGQRAHVLTLRDVTDRRLVAEERRLSAARIRRALVQTIEAISRTVETRDPYTAGHQRRVAALARLMARELGLDTETVDGVYMGGMIHDIGKLYIPAEILNRSGQLNEVEFLLMKTHCAVGRDIIGGIAFPWPLAAMIHQHHERLDGSGYPQGLRGEEILFEARILAVADVVDAMSSRRPYREALGLTAALHAIGQGRGRYFDPAVVDVCQRLFLQQGVNLAALEVNGGE